MPALPLTFGCHLPMFGPIATRGNVLAFARTMEALGYESLWASDHVVLPYSIKSKYPYNSSGQFPLPPTSAFLEPLTTLALVAGVTERARLGTSILVLPHRHPVLAAKTLATLDHLAEGRVILGVGVGWMREEIEILGGNYDRRGAWSDEAIRIMRACWSQERARYRGNSSPSTRSVWCPSRCARPSPSGWAAIPRGRCAAWPSWATAGMPRSRRRTRSSATSRGSAPNARRSTVG